MDHEDRLAEARRALDKGEELDEITARRVFHANGEALRTLAVMFGPPRLPPGLQVYGDPAPPSPTPPRAG